MPAIHRLMAFGLVLLLSTSVALHAQEPAPAFKAGFAERDITPEIGAEAPGGYGKSYHRILHDPCKVRAVVFDDGKNRTALVGLDALSVHRDTVLNVRKAIAQKTGMAEGRDPARGVALALFGRPCPGCSPASTIMRPRSCRSSPTSIRRRRPQVPGEVRTGYHRGGLSCP